MFTLLNLRVSYLLVNYVILRQLSLHYLIRIDIKVADLLPSVNHCVDSCYVEARLTVLNLIDGKLPLFVTLKHVFPDLGSSTRNT